MTKEEVLAGVQDLILALKQPHFEWEDFRKKWSEKLDKVTDGYDELSDIDQKWVDQEQNIWYKEVLKPEVTEEQQYPWEVFQGEPKQKHQQNKKVGE